MNIKIEIKIRNKGNLLANTDLMFLVNDFGWITIKDFIIWESNVHNERLDAFINIQPPSTRMPMGKYIKRVFFEDQKCWENLERLVYKEYLKKQAESTPIDINAVEASSK